MTNFSKIFKNKLNSKNILVIIITPILILSSYFYLIGRNRFFVRADVVVRKASNNVSSDISISSLLGSNNLSSIEDARYLQTYLESPQVLKDLEKKIDFVKLYKRKGLDLYAGLGVNPSKERKFDFFRRQISVSLNDASGVMRIRTLAFDPKTAYEFNKFLISQAEVFVNKLNQDIYKKQLVFLNNEVVKSLNRLNKTSEEITSFKQDNRFLDPKSEVSAAGAYISALESEMIKLKVELAGLKRTFVSPETPEIVELENLIGELSDQINNERNFLAGPKGKNLNKKLSTLIYLENKLKYEEDLYKAALTASEKTRVDSLQKQRFLAILSNPQFPQDQWNYWRHKGFLTSISIFLVGFGLTKFVLGMSDSHRQ